MATELLQAAAGLTRVEEDPFRLRIETCSAHGLTLYLIHSCSVTWHATHTHQLREDEGRITHLHEAVFPSHPFLQF